MKEAQNLKYEVPEIATREKDRRWFKNEATGYVRQGMPRRTEEQSTAMRIAAEEKRQRRAAKMKKHAVPKA